MGWCIRNRGSDVFQRRRAISSADTSYYATSNYTGRLSVEPLESWHLYALDIQDDQSWVEDHIGDKDTYADTVLKAGPAFAMTRDGGEVIGCAGVWVMESHRATAWAIIDRNIGTDYIHYHKAVKKFLDESDYQRIEMAVDQGFEPAKRWATMLGFKQEGFMHKYFPNGNDAFLYARVQ